VRLAVDVQLTPLAVQILAGIARKKLREKFVACCARGCTAVSNFAEEFLRNSRRNFRCNPRCIAAIFVAVLSITFIDSAPREHNSSL